MEPRDDGDMVTIILDPITEEQAAQVRKSPPPELCITYVRRQRHSQLIDELYYWLLPFCEPCRAPTETGLRVFQDKPPLSAEDAEQIRREILDEAATMTGFMAELATFAAELVTTDVKPLPEESLRGIVDDQVRGACSDIAGYLGGALRGAAQQEGKERVLRLARLDDRMLPDDDRDIDAILGRAKGCASEVLRLARASLPPGQTLPPMLRELLALDVVVLLNPPPQHDGK